MLDKEIKKNEYFFSMVTKILVVAIGLIQQVIIARYLGAYIKGQLSYIQNLVGIASIIAMVGLHHSYPVLRRRNTFKNSDRDIFLSGVLFLFFSYFVLFCIIILIFTVHFETKAVLLVTPIVGYANIVSYVFMIENPNLRNIDLLTFSIFDLFLYLGSFFFLIPNLLIGIFIVYFIEALKMLVFTKKLRISWIINHNTFKVLCEQLRIGFFPMIALLLTSLNYKLDIIMLSNASNITASDVGVYSVAIGIAEKALLLPDALKEILISKLSKGANYIEVMKVNRVGIAFTLLTALCICIFCNPVVNIFFGAEYKGAVNLIRVTTFGTVFMVIFKMVGSYNIVRNKQWINVVFLASSVIFNLLFNVLLIPKYGYYGAAYATIISFLVCGIIFTTYFCTTEKVPLNKFLVLDKEDLSIIKNYINKKVKN